MGEAGGVRARREQQEGSESGRMPVHAAAHTHTHTHSQAGRQAGAPTCRYCSPASSAGSAGDSSARKPTAMRK